MQSLGPITLPISRADALIERVRRVEPGRPMAPLTLYWLLFAGSITCFCVHSVWGAWLGPVDAVLAIAGSTTCGFAWLLARAVFRGPDHSAGWPRGLVGIMVLSAAIIVIGGTPVDGSAPPLFARIARTVHMLLSSTVLILTFIEPLENLHRPMPDREYRFRLATAGGYAAIFAFAVLWIRGADDTTLSADWATRLKVASALIALGCARWAVTFRAAHPLEPVASAAKRRPKSAPTVDSALSAQILTVAARPEVFTQPDIKVADFAHLLGQPDYKVTQCITGDLGFRNFNRLINQFRIDEAKKRLADPAWDDRSILTIAIESGFGSIGPFNRAFKERVGMPPSRYRALSRKPE